MTCSYTYTLINRLSNGTTLELYLDSDLEWISNGIRNNRRWMGMEVVVISAVCDWFRSMLDIRLNDEIDDQSSKPQRSQRLFFDEPHLTQLTTIIDFD